MGPSPQLCADEQTEALSKPIPPTRERVGAGQAGFLDLEGSAASMSEGRLAWSSQLQAKGVSGQM